MRFKNISLQGTKSILEIHSINDLYFPLKSLFIFTASVLVKSNKSTVKKHVQFPDEQSCVEGFGDTSPTCEEKSGTLNLIMSLKRGCLEKMFDTTIKQLAQYKGFFYKS